jgi:hypothetical protein
MRFVCVIAVLLGLSSVCVADVVAEDGFVLGSGGYWYKSGVPYTRTKITGGYWTTSYNGCYSCRIWQPTYYYDYSKAVPDVATVSPTDPDYRSKLLDIAAARDKVVGQIRKANAQSNDFQAEVKALGLDGNFRWDNYGQGPIQSVPYIGQAGGGYSAVGNYGASGNTIYGYNVVADAYGAVDLNSLFQQFATSVKDAQTLAGQAHTDFSDVVKQVGKDAGAVAEIKAKGQAVTALAAQVRAEPRTTVQARVFSFRMDPQGNLIPIQPSPGPVATADPRPAVVAFASCMSCHSGADAKGKLDLSKWDSMTSDQQWTVLGRVSTDDLGKRMPRKPDGTVGDRVSREEFLAMVAKVKK